MIRADTISNFEVIDGLAKALGKEGDEQYKVINIPVQDNRGDLHN